MEFRSLDLADVTLGGLIEIAELIPAKELECVLQTRCAW